MSQRTDDPFWTVAQKSNKVFKQGAIKLQKGTRLLGKAVGTVVVGAADAVHLTTAFNLTTHGVAVFGRKAGITTGVQKLRRQFFREYAGMDIPELDAEEDLADADDGIILNDDELEVEERFFEKDFDAVDWEVNFLIHLGDDEELEVIRVHLELHELKRRRQHDLVAMTLKKRVLLRHSEFVDAINEVMKVLQNLHATAEACVAARMRLAEAKHTCAVRGLRIPMLDRRRRRLQVAAVVVESMKQFISRYNRVTRHLENSEYSEAVHIMQETTQEHLPPHLLELKAMEPIIRKWKELHSPGTLIRYVHRYVDTCLVNFNASKYIDVMEGVRQSYNYQLGELTRQRIGVKLQERLMTIIKSSMAKVSTVKDLDAPIERIATGIESSAMTLCTSSMCIQLVGFLRELAFVIKAHEDVIDATKLQVEMDPSSQQDPNEPSSTIPFHTKCMGDLKLALRDFDLPRQLGCIITFAPLHSLDKSSRYHIIQLCRMLIEALVPFLVGLPEQQQIHHQRRGGVLSPTGAAFFISKETLYAPINSAAIGILKRIEYVTQAAELLQLMLQDSWASSSEDKTFILQNFVVRPMGTQLFDKEASLMAAFVDPTNEAAENPFFEYQHPVNTAGFFGDSNGPALSPRSGAVRQKVYFDMVRFHETRFCDPHRMTFTTSAVHFHGFMNTMLFEMIVRVPSIADGVLRLFENLVGSYIFMLSDMLMKKHKDHQLVDDTRFSPFARQVFRSIVRPDSGDNVFASFTSDKRFPPRIFTEDRWVHGFADEKQLFCVGDRLTALETNFSVVCLYESFIDSVSGLLSKEAYTWHTERASSLKSTVSELLEVGCQMISTAIIQPTLSTLLTNLNGSRFDHSGSSFIRKFTDAFKRDDLPRIRKALVKAPTQYSQDIFWARLYFAVLDTMAKALAPNRSKLSDKTIANCLADVQALQENLKQAIPSKAGAELDGYVVRFLQTYYINDAESEWKWIEQNHVYYHADDLCRWFGSSSVESQRFLTMEKRLSDALGRRRSHDAQLKLVNPTFVESTRAAAGKSTF